MKKFIITIILLILLALTGCSFAEKANVSNRFETVEIENSFVIIVDRETNVMYAVSAGAYNTGTVTLLVDAEGKPLMWKGDFKD